MDQTAPPQNMQPRFFNGTRSTPPQPATGQSPYNTNDNIRPTSAPQQPTTNDTPTNTVNISRPVNPQPQASQQFGTQPTVSTSTPNTTPAQTPQVSQTSSDDSTIQEIEDLEVTVRQCKNMPPDLAEIALRNIERLRRMAKRGSYTGEFETISQYIHWTTSIPWGVTTKDNLDIHNVKEMMDSTHYGMDLVKNLIVDYIAVMKLQQDRNLKSAADQSGSNQVDMATLRGSSANAPVMLFVGLQGVGKTSIAKSIAKAMGRKFARIAVGAVGSVQALRGQSRALPNAEPGQIIKALVRTKTMNPVILLDEIDKASGNVSLLNDLMAALLEILDPEQNNTFVDHYIDYPVDLSKVFFIATANNLGSLSAALLDRMEIIRFTSYSDEEKTHIAKLYSLPKVLKNMGLSSEQIVIEDDVWPILVRPVGFDAGLRQLERNISTMVRAAARKIVEGAPQPIVITKDNIRDFVLPDQGPLS